MSIKANKAAIGAFVLAALILVVAGVAFFGSWKLFVPQKKYVMYFDSSVKGLSVGSPVNFRGVKIGSVSDIALQGNMEKMTFRVPVVAEIDLGRFQMEDGTSPDSAVHQRLVDRGLRAQLQTQSLVTGQLMINFDFHPDTQARIVSDDTGYTQIPTIPSTAHQLAQKLEELPLEQLVERTNALVGGLERLVNSSDMQEAPRTLNLTLAEARKLIGKMDRETGLLAADARQVLKAATATFERADRALDFEKGPSAEVVNNINRTLVDAQESLARFDETLNALRNVATNERSQYQLRHALRELEETSSALGSLIDYLDRHPESLLRGKTHLEGK